MLLTQQLLLLLQEEQSVQLSELGLLGLCRRLALGRERSSLCTHTSPHISHTCAVVAVVVGEVFVAASEPEVALPGEDTTCCWLSCCRSVAWLASCCCCLSRGSSSAPLAAVWFRRREVLEAREFPEPKLCR